MPKTNRAYVTARSSALAQLRVRAGLTRAAAAERLAIASGSLANVERGVATVSGELAIRMSEVYGVAIEAVHEAISASRGQLIAREGRDGREPEVLKGIKFMSLAELEEAAERQKADLPTEIRGKGWRVAWAPKSLTIDIFSPQKRLLYQLDLERSESGSQMLDCILQVRAKTWCTDEMVGAVLRVLDNVCWKTFDNSAQALYSPGGRDGDVPAARWREAKKRKRTK